MIRTPTKASEKWFENSWIAIWIRIIDDEVVLVEHRVYRRANTCMFGLS